MGRYEVVIVGAGHGGAQAAAALRQAKFEGTIAVIGEEPELPYERPPLSKEYFSGEKSFERIVIRPAAFWEERNVEMRLGQRVAKVDATAHELTLEDGRTLGYGKLVWATGGSPRRLTCSGGDLVGVHTVRTRADVDRILAELDSVTHAVVIGGGYIGLEAAAVLSKFGKRTTVLEALDRVLARVAGEPLSRFYEAEHRAHSVDLRLSANVDCIVGVNGKVAGVQLHGGEVLPCEMVIVGIGIIPAVQPLIEAGAQGGNGVAVDAQCRTTLPDVFGIGDCALHANDFAECAHIRLESVQNATDQATIAAKTIVGEDVRYHTVPWFWSNQYDLRLQTVGLSTGFDRCVIRGDPATRSFSIIYLKRGKVIALDCVNKTKDFVQGRALVIDGKMIPEELLADATTPLNAMAARA